MDNRKKNLIYSVLLLSAVFVVWKYRQSKAEKESPIKIEGRTMGTTYHITYFDPKKRNFKEAVDSLLLVVNKSINNYDPTSEVSVFNASPKGVAVKLPYLLPPLHAARLVFDATNGAFDPTVMPLVNVWGFGPGKRAKPSSAQVDSIKHFVGYNNVLLRKDSILKNDPRVQLDFGRIDQKYGADVIAEFLSSKGIVNMLGELGGEGMAIGKNLVTGKPWEIGILDPNSTYENQFFKAYVSLSNRSFTTSGNYFNYHEEDGVKYSHTIDPFSGYPSQKKILSASVFSTDCTHADAWGTALMVLGHEQAIKVIEARKDLDAIIMYSGKDGKVETYISERIREQVTLEQTP